MTRRSPDTTISSIIKGSLYQAGHRAAQAHAAKADLVVHCAHGIQPPRARGTKTVVLPMSDDPMWDWRRDQEALAKILKVSKGVAQYVRAKKTVIVCCQAGWNRSGLVTAFALCYLGLSPEQAILLLRKRRGTQVLSNSAFASAVLAVGSRLKGRQKGTRHVHDQGTAQGGHRRAYRPPENRRRVGAQRPAGGGGGRTRGPRRSEGEHLRPRHLQEEAPEGSNHDHPHDGREKAHSRWVPGPGLGVQEAEGLGVETIEDLISDIESPSSLPDLPIDDGPGAFDAIAELDGLDLDAEDPELGPSLEVIEGGA